MSISLHGSQTCLEIRSQSGEGFFFYYLHRKREGHRSHDQNPGFMQNGLESFDQWGLDDDTQHGIGSHAFGTNSLSSQQMFLR